MKNVSENIFGVKESNKLKGLLAIIMFWSHMFNHPNRIQEGVSWISMGYINGKSIEVLLCPFFHISVPLFFFISGYGFSIIDRNRRYDLYKLRTQIIKLFRKYWIVFALSIPASIFIGIISFEPKEFVLNFIGLSSSYCGEWWFLSTYIEILVVFYVIIKIFPVSKYRSGFLLCGYLLFATAGYAGVFFLKKIGVDTNNLLIHEVYYLCIKSPMFVMGYFIAEKDLINKLYCWIKKQNNNITTIILMSLFVFVIIGPYAFSKVPETYFYIVYMTPFVLLFCFINKLIERNSLINRMFEVLGKYSIYMWLCHSILLYKFLQKIIYFPRLSILCWIWLILFTLVVSIILTKIEVKLLQIVDSIRNINVIRSHNERKSN